MIEFDVVVIGGGPAGSLMARNMARNGFRTVILEKKLRDTMGADTKVIHLEPRVFERAGMPQPTAPELIASVENHKTWLPGRCKFIQARIPTLVLNLPLFIQRLHGMAEDAGAQLWDYTEYVAPIIKGPGIKGIVAVNSQGQILEIKSRLVVDASGIKAEVRTSIPPSMGINTNPVSLEEILTVYLEFRSDPDKTLPQGIHGYPWHIGWLAPGYGDTRIFGIGAYGGLTAAKEAHEKFMAECFPDLDLKVVETTSGHVPYRRPPVSMVADGLMCIGDSVCQNRPFSGEGIASGFDAARIASESATWALKSGMVTARGLWPYNVRWFREFESRFSAIRTLMPAMTFISPSELGYLYESGLVTGKSTEQMHLNYEVKHTKAEEIAQNAAIVWGLGTGRLKLNTVRSLLSRMTAAQKLRAHIAEYPLAPGRIGEWTTELERLQAGL